MNHPVGTTTNTFVVTDASGNTGTCSFNVTVVDAEAPVVDCSQPAGPPNVLTNASFETGAVFNQPFGGGASNWTPFGAVFAIDANIIPPGQNGNFYLKMFGGNSGVFQDVPVNGGDNLNASVFIENASFDPMLPGCTGFLKLEYFDAGGNFISATESNRLDNTLPSNTWTQLTLADVAPANAATVRYVAIMQCTAGGAVFFDDASLRINGNVSGGLVGDVTVNNDPGICGAQLNLAIPLTTDNCGVASVTNSFNGTGDASGLYPVGTTVVTWTVTDSAGNVDSCDVTITVNDTELPTIDCSQGAGPQNALTNSSFEIGAAFNQPFGGGTTGWAPFGAVFAIDANSIPAAQDGDFYLKMFGGNSGVFQDVPVNGGDSLSASVYIQNASFDPMLPGCTGFIKLEYFDAAGGFISAVESNRLDNTLPSNTWTQLTFDDVAPANAATVRYVAIMQCTAGGAVFFDNAV